MKKLLGAIIALLATLAIICAVAVPSKAADFSDKYELYESWNNNLKVYTREVSEELDIPYSALVAIIYHESRFNSDVGTSYIGLMQVGCTSDILNFLSNNGLKTSKNGLYNPETNIRAGALILRYAMDKSTNMEDAFYIYTCGEGAVKKRKANGQKKNKATIEITELYYDYSNYFAKQNKNDYRLFLLDELNSVQDELNETNGLLQSCEAYQSDYYNQQLLFIEQKLDFINSELENLE